MSPRLSVCILMVTAALVSLPQLAAGEEKLSLIGAEKGAIDLIVPSSGLVPLAFHHPGTNARVFVIDLNGFLSADDQIASVGFVGDGDAVPVTSTRLEFEQGTHRTVLDLYARELVRGVTYSGTLTASSSAGLKTWKVSFHRPSPQAQLVADLSSVELDIAQGNPVDYLRALFGSQVEPPAFLLTLSESSRKVSVVGITLRRAVGSETVGTIDLQRNLRFTLDGEKVELLSSSPDQVHLTLRSIPPGKQRALRVEVVDFPSGEHKLTLQLDAENAKAGTAPTVELTVRVRHSIAWPILVLLIAISLSYFVTKGIVNWRQRLALRARTRLLHREWLQDLHDFAPVVWLKATRKQAEITLDSFSLLPAPGELAARCDTAIRLLELLRRYHDLRDQLAGRSFKYMMNWRMQRELDKIVRRIEPDLLDKANAILFKTEFDAFEQSIGDPVSLYQPLVMGARRRVRSLVSFDAISADAAVKPKLEKLFQDYIITDPPANLSEDNLVVIDRVCASFRVLWRHQVNINNADILAKLVALIAQDDATKIPIEAVFSLTNDAQGNRIAEEIKNGNAQIVPSKQRPKATPIRALQPTRFEIRLDNEELCDSFMLKSKLKSDWHFELTPAAAPKKWLRWFQSVTPKETAPLPWTTETSGKTLVQFAPRAGTLRTTVQLRYENLNILPIEGETSIEPSDSSLTNRLFAIEEFVLIIASFAIALASGLVLYYVPKPTFGSLQDYLALFTWGIGVDQGKNLVQTFQTLRTQSRATGGVGSSDD